MNGDRRLYWWMPVGPFPIDEIENSTSKPLRRGRLTALVKMFVVLKPWSDGMAEKYAQS